MFLNGRDTVKAALEKTILVSKILLPSLAIYRWNVVEVALVSKFEFQSVVVNSIQSNLIEKKHQIIINCGSSCCRDNSWWYQSSRTVHYHPSRQRRMHGHWSQLETSGSNQPSVYWRIIKLQFPSKGRWQLMVCPNWYQWYRKWRRLDQYLHKLVYS